MDYPPLVSYASPNAYLTHFEHVYCKGVIFTFDHIAVRFRKSSFRHCFFESSLRNKVKDKFSQKRAERIDWIKVALEDPNAELYVGWDKKRKQYDNTRRVTLANGVYVVVIHLKTPVTADFVTAYVADATTSGKQLSTVQKIKSSPKWQ